MKKILVIGLGTIGSAVVNLLKKNHNVITASRSHGDYQVDLENQQSLLKIFSEVSDLDAVVCSAGLAAFASLDDMDEQKLLLGINNKLLGQVRVALLARKYLKDNGSVTLISGILNEDPIYTGASAAMVNGGLEGFVKAAAIDMPRGIRINLVSPTVLEESLDKYAKFFPGYPAVTAAKVAAAYLKSIDGHQTGEIYKVGF